MRKEAISAVTGNGFRHLGRLFCAVLLAVILVSVVACGGSGQTGAKKLRLGLVLPDLTNQTINDIYVGAQARAKELGTVEILEGGTSETAPWLNACERIVNSGIDVLAYDTLDAAGTSTCIKQANDKGIKVICIFACVAEGKNDLLVTIDVTADGKQIGNWMAKAVGPGSEVGFLEGPPGDDAAQGIGKGFKAGLAEGCPDCKLVVDVPGGHDRNTGYTVGLQALTAHPNIKGMYGLNDDIAMGILRAAQQLGRLDKIKVAGHNGTCEALGSILKGDLDFTMLLAGQPFGIAIVDAAIKLKAGEKVESANVTPIPLDQAKEKGILDGSVPNPPGVDVKARLQKAQSGCS